MARPKTMPRHTAAPEQSDPQAAQTQATESQADQTQADQTGAAQGSAEPDESTEQRPGTRGATTSRHGRSTPKHEHHSVFEERAVLDALWSAVVAAPTSVMPPASPDAEPPDEPAPSADAPPHGVTTEPSPPAPAAPEPPTPTTAPSRTPEGSRTQR